MLGDISGVDHIYLVTGYTDMRRSIDGLCAISKISCAWILFEFLFLFCGKRRDRIKAIMHEPDGMVLLYKRLTVKGHYEWPRNKTEVETSPGSVRLADVRS
ncbi:MAG: IS66 family insertion sequence element accessory protein TnpB [bacterium LCO1.1]|uniref:IS66 family insertion sequence element accessory protein TnpB n=1 Tax=Candidatus Weimeria bifida TaxID=2599074 RepID=A0A6N7IXL6_9FIRM|nr:IS66 family insertion sequence element accessory protein TnpB [Candidatus Weimeria bifida]